MTAWAEFDEKPYETLFALELARPASPPYSPGQRDEYYLGFDAAFDVPLRAIRGRFPHLVSSGWPGLSGFPLSELDHLPERTWRRLRKLRFNFFVQYKRPERVSGHRGAEWNSWGKPYYRYEITPHQQAALARIDQTSGDRAAVVYAAAVFLEMDYLYRLAKSGNIIAKSNIARVSQMTDHERFTYVSPGGCGFAHSEPKEVKGPAFQEILRDGLEQERLPFRDHIIKTAQIIEASLEDNLEKHNFSTARQAVLFLSGMGSGDVEVGTIAHALATIEAFSGVFNVSLYAIG